MLEGGYGKVAQLHRVLDPWIVHVDGRRSGNLKTWARAHRAARRLGSGIDGLQVIYCGGNCRRDHILLSDGRDNRLRRRCCRLSAWRRRNRIERRSISSRSSRLQFLRCRTRLRSGAASCLIRDTLLRQKKKQCAFEEERTFISPQSPQQKFHGRCATYLLKSARRGLHSAINGIYNIAKPLLGIELLLFYLLHSTPHT